MIPKEWDDFCDCLAPSCHGQTDCKHCTARLGLAAADIDLSMMKGDDALDEGQSQAAPFRAAGICSAVKLLEDLWLVFHGNARAGIGHFDDNGLSILRGAHLHRIFTGCELEGVLDQVIDGQDKEVAIPGNRGKW